VSSTLDLDSIVDSSAQPPVRPGVLAASVGVSVPERIVPNAEIEARLGVPEDWIARRTGIHSRRIAGPQERLQDHATEAARIALARAGTNPVDVDLVIVATSTSDEIMPAAAPLVAHDLGATRAGAFDIGSACTGFLSALAVGAAQVEAGRAHCVVVVGADLMSRITDPDDRPTAAVFADGAGAVVLESTSHAGRIGPVVLGADGAGADHIRVGRGPSDSTMRMLGHETFREAVARLSLSTHQAVRAAGVTVDDIDLFVYHQANARITKALGEKLELPPERVVDCIETLGNSSAATLPVALAVAEQDGRLRPGSKVLVSAFGAGFTWGGGVITWPGADG
jgi:3-oxoacyl-[acyl-carrier-protein] synthase III